MSNISKAFYDDLNLYSSELSLPAGCVDAGLLNPDEVLRSKLLLFKVKFFMFMKKNFK